MDTNGHESMQLGLSSRRSAQPELCSQGTLPAAGLTRSREAAKGNAQFRSSAGEPRTGVRGCVATDVFFATDEHGFSRIIAGGMGCFEPRMDTNGHEWTRMDTNRCSWGFPAGDQPSRSCAARERCRLLVSREAAKPRREMHNFEVQQASRGRESAGASPRMFFSPRMNTDFHG